MGVCHYTPPMSVELWILRAEVYNLKLYTTPGCCHYTPPWVYNFWILIIHVYNSTFETCIPFCDLLFYVNILANVKRIFILWFILRIIHPYEVYNYNIIHPHGCMSLYTPMSVELWILRADVYNLKLYTTPRCMSLYTPMSV